MSVWTPDRIAQLVARWPTTSASQLAYELGLGLTRNAIIGKAHALGLVKGRAPSQGNQFERRKAGEVVGGIRKAYKSKGDDVSLSRFVKVKGASRVHRKQWQLPTLAKPFAAADKGVSRFHAKGVKPVSAFKSLLVSGHSNVKIGRDVRKGALRGYWIYTLTLEERATCPRTCEHWRSCYGNNMPWAKRVDHGDPVALMEAIERDIKRLLSVRGRRGILVRLHALGDFFSVPYVWFWAKLLDKHPRLAVYGYSAWHPGTDIGNALVSVRQKHGSRFAVRFSNGGLATNCTVSLKSFDSDTRGAIVCPEQSGATAACATCALCWSTDRNIGFVEH